jgi:hypothetical protein
MTTSIPIELNATSNTYLSERNRKYYRGHSAVVHPLYNKELTNAIKAITHFINLSVLNQATYLRTMNIYKLSADKCWNNKNNNYTFSEARECEQLILERDSILNNIKDYVKEVEVRIQDSYEKEVKYSKDNSIKNHNFSIEKYEEDHRKFLLKLNFVYRYYFYFTAKRLFIDSLKE